MAFSQAECVPPLIAHLLPQVRHRWVSVDTGVHGVVPIWVVRPEDAAGPVPAVLLLHGGGWALGDATTHERLVRDLAARAHVAVVFPEYTRSPEARFPVALEQCAAVAEWIFAHGRELLIDPTSVGIVGDSSGGNLAAALMGRMGSRFRAQVLLYPALDPLQQSTSYFRFGSGFRLTDAAMTWFWAQYVPGRAARHLPAVSPLRASQSMLAAGPPALVITAEADVLRDEGEHYAQALRRAGVAVTGVRYTGTVHDFMTLAALHETPTTQSAITQTVSFLQAKLRGLV